MNINREDVISVEIPASTKYLSILSDCIECILKRNENILYSYVYPVQMAVHETCSNIVEHACANFPNGYIKVVFTIKIEEKIFAVDIYDNGDSFDIDMIEPPLLDTPQIRGYGLFIVHKLMDNVLYQPMSGNNHWRLVKYFN